MSKNEKIQKTTDKLEIKTLNITEERKKRKIRNKNLKK